MLRLGLGRRGLTRHFVSFLVGSVVGAIFYALSQPHSPYSPSSRPSIFDFRPEYDLVVLVLSSVGYTDRRHAVRETWASECEFEVKEGDASSERRKARAKVLFVVGNRRVEPGVLLAAVEEGHDHGNDMLFVNTGDDFDALTEKVIAGFRLASEKYRSNYVLKVDDDSYVNLPKMLEELESKPREKFYWGYFWGRANVKKHGKYEEGGWFLCDRYLPYALGGGYVLSSDLVAYIAESSSRFRPYRAEDVTVGTWLSPLDIVRSHDVRFDTEYISRGCSDDYLVTHKKSAMAMRDLHKVFSETGGKKICEKEVVHVRAYVYNWDVLPTKCCERPLDV